MKPLIVIGVIVVGLVIAGGVAKSMKPLPPGVAASAKPNCELPVDMHPTALFTLVNSKKQEYQSMYSSMIGCMVPASGWEGQVTEVSGNTLRFQVGTGLAEYTITVAMRETPTVQAGSSVKYRGRFDGASAKVVMGNVMNRIELSDGEIVP
jgi:hypothetical protein